MFPCWKFVLSFAAVIIVAAGCRPPKKAARLETPHYCQPHSLTVDSIGSHYARIAWNPGCAEFRVMRGFRIFLSPEPLAEKYPGRDLPETIKPYNFEFYPGDDFGRLDRETFEFKNLPMAERFFVHVRVVNSDETYSLPTNEVEIVCIPQGRFALASSYSGENDGYSFVEDRPCRTTDLENDLYFYHKEGKDYLCSPSRISAVNRANKVFTGGNSPSSNPVDLVVPEGDGYDRVVMSIGGEYIIKTEEGHFVRLKLVALDGIGDDRRAIFDYYYHAPVKKGGQGI